MANAMDVHVQVKICDGVRVQLDKDEALRSGEHLLHVHGHLGRERKRKKKVKNTCKKTYILVNNTDRRQKNTTE